MHLLGYIKYDEGASFRFFYRIRGRDSERAPPIRTPPPLSIPAEPVISYSWYIKIHLQIYMFT